MILNAGSSGILQKCLPRKKDLGSFNIHCSIGGLGEEKALADSGVSINVMPYKFFKKLGLGRCTCMTLQLADRLVQHPTGIVEDVLIKVDKYIFLIDFIVLDVDDDVEDPCAHSWKALLVHIKGSN